MKYHLTPAVLAAATAAIFGTASGTSAAQTEPCTVTGARPASPESLHALEACETARARFAELFGDPVPPVRLVIWNRAGYRIGTADGAAVVFWPGGGTPGARPDDAAAERRAELQWREVLPHEMAHALLSARFFPEDGPPHGGYGTPFPDWLDEAVAIWAEPLATRRKRLETARSLPGELMELEAILTDPHPGTGNAAALAMRDGGPVPRDTALLAFYPRSIAVLKFVYSAGGQPALIELAARLLGEPKDPAALAGLPGLPADQTGVLEAWSEWIAAATAGANVAPEQPSGAGDAAAAPEPCASC